MKIKGISFILAFLMLFMSFCSCTDDSNGANVSSKDGTVSDVSSQEVSSEEIKYYNNLTGCYEFKEAEKSNLRPVAVMINNIRTAQKVQTGLAGASIVYEALAEGGITRLLAIFKDVGSMGEIGTVRSARYSFVDLANGHDAMYFHCGLDKTFCGPYMKSMNLDDVDINTYIYEDYGYRFKNGLAREHTMYTSGQLIKQSMIDKDRRTQLKDGSIHAQPWQNFADEDKTVTLTDGTASKASIYFSGSYVTTFEYDSGEQKYIKHNKSGNDTDYRTGELLSYKNVLVLFSSLSYFEGNYRVYNDLKSGEGYYMTNGTLKNIKWSKGDSYDSFKITDSDGNAVEFSAGNTYVCIPPLSLKNKTAIS